MYGFQDLVVRKHFQASRIHSEWVGLDKRGLLWALAQLGLVDLTVEPREGGRGWELLEAFILTVDLVLAWWWSKHRPPFRLQI